MGDLLFNIFPPPTYLFTYHVHLGWGVSLVNLTSGPWPLCLSRLGGVLSSVRRFFSGLAVLFFQAVVFRGSMLCLWYVFASQPCPCFRVGKLRHMVVSVQGPPGILM